MSDEQQNVDDIVAQAMDAPEDGEIVESDEDLEAQMAAAMEAELAESADAPEPAAAAPAVGNAAAPQASEPAFAELQPGSHASEEVPISMLMDLTLPVSIELGRTTMTVQEILRLGRSAVIQLERMAGEPVDIFVGNRRFAEGEVVVLGEHFGVRITQIHSRVGHEETDGA